MRINPDFRLRTVAGVNMLINEGTRKVSLNALLTLNEAAAWLWSRAAEFCRQSGDGVTEEMLVGWLTEEYDVDAETAAKDVADIVRQWREYAIVEN